MSITTRLEEIPEINRRYVQIYIRHKSLAGISDKTIVNNVAYLVPFLRDWYRDKDLKDITRDDIEDYFFEYRKTHATSTQRCLLISIKMLVADVLGEERAEHLFKGIHVKVPLTKVRDEELLTDEEIKRMVSACYSERDRALITLLYSSGCRSGEVLGLKIKDLTFSQYGASIHVNGKTGERDVDLFVGVPELKAWYNVHPERDNPQATLWPSLNTSDPITHAGLWFLLRRVAKRANIPEGKRIHPHAFRHKRATDCAQFMTTADMKEMFGWTTGSDMPSIYVHSSRKRVAEKLMVQAGIKVPEQKMPTSMVIQCPSCGCLNSSTATLCAFCSKPLKESTLHVAKEVRDFQNANAEDIISAYNNLMKNKKDPDQHA